LEIYPQYKAHRKPAPPDFYAQVPILKQLLKAFGWPLYELDDYEADDIMGTLSRQANDRGIHTIIISSDLDMLQILDNDTELYALKRGLTNLEKFDVAAFEKKYGLKISQFLDLKSLKGDASDNIPGVPGIGEKSATELLQKYGSLEEIYNHLEDIKPAWRTKLVAGRDSAWLSRDLARIWCDAPLKLNLDTMDVRHLETDKLAKELRKLEFTSLIRRLPNYMQSAVIDQPTKQFNRPTDIEVTTNSRHQVALVMPDGKIITHNAKTYFEALLADGQALPELEHDTKLGAFLLNSLRKAPDLDRQEADEVWSLYMAQKEQFQKNQKLYRLAKQIDFPLQAVLAKIEQRGVRLDSNQLAKTSRQLAIKIADLEQQIWQIVGYEFNVSSSPQLSEALFNKLGLPSTGIKKSVRGYFSTGKAELDKLRSLHPIIDKITEVREVLKLKNTYADSLPNLVDNDGKLHTDFQQDITATGRLSSSNPNLQNIPARSELGREIRRAFVASKGKVLVSADYSQFELRLAAALAGDTNLIEDFQDDSIDIHTKTAAEAYGTAFDDVTPEMRRHAKVINFGVLYGMSPHGLAAATGMTFDDAKDFIERYFRARQPIRDFIDATIAKAQTDGYVETYFGRRRPTPDAKSANFMVREAAKRAAANMPIQGTEADLMKMAMLKVEQDLASVADQILQIHDSILVECRPDDVAIVSHKIKTLMENIYPAIGVRLKVDVKTGTNWGEF
jgi:DNA polymerase-1